MRTKLTPILLLLCLFITGTGYAGTTDSLLVELDQSIKERKQYEAGKLNRIDSIAQKLQLSHLSAEERYEIHMALYNEYESYNCDSALHHAQQGYTWATRLNQPDLQNRALLKKASVLGSMGLYGEALELLQGIPQRMLPSTDLADYYSTMACIYLFQAEYAEQTVYIHKYLKYLNTYRDSIVQVLSPHDYRYANHKASLLVDEGKLREAAGLLEKALESLNPSTREYAILTSTLAFVYHTSGDRKREKEMRIHSAIADIKAVVKENYSLCALAEILYAEGDIKRANDYIKISMEDAEHYSTPLRRLQISQVLPLITDAYQQEKERQQQKLTWMNIAITLLLLVLTLTIVRMVRQMHKLAKARQEVVESNRSLREANHIKEEYLGKLLNQCSAYIDKLEEYRRLLNRQASAGKLEELFKTLKSNRFINNELKEFYHSFDASFLKIFPHFVEDFNRLLPEDEQQHPKEGELLTTELRIFALVRLGITDSARIAGFLRYSITTIYTYRSKMKNRSLCKETFEEEIMKIASY